MPKTCNQCGETKLLSEFYRHPKSKDGLQCKCKPCMDNYISKWKQKNPGAVYRLQKKRIKKQAGKQMTYACKAKHHKGCSRICYLGGRAECQCFCHQIQCEKCDERWHIAGWNGQRYFRYCGAHYKEVQNA